MTNGPAPVPAERMGPLLRRARTARRLSVRAAAEQLGISRHLLSRYERGVEAVTPEHLAGLAALYGTSTEELVPTRRAVVVDQGRATLAIGGMMRSTGPSSDGVLSDYLTMLYTLRGVRPGDPIPLRDDDLDALADALGSDPAVVEERLVELMGCTREEAAALRRMILRRRVLAPAATIVVGAGLIGGVRAAAQRPDGSSDRAAVEATTTTGPPPAASTTSGPTTTAPPATAPTTAPTTTPTTAPVSEPPSASPSSGAQEDAVTVDPAGPPGPPAEVEAPPTTPPPPTSPPEMPGPPYRFAPETDEEPVVIVDAPGESTIERAEP